METGDRDKGPCVVLRRPGPWTAAAFARLSQTALDRPLLGEASGAHGGPPTLSGGRHLHAVGELVVASFAEPLVVLGAFQRRVDSRRLLASGLASGTRLSPRVVRRISGGPAVWAAGGTAYVALCLSHPAALADADVPRVVNRYVRPLLRAVTARGHAGPAHYFGRDWISVKHRPVGWVGFAHDARTGRAVFEAFVAVTTPFAQGREGAFLGKDPATLAELGGVAAARRTDAVAELEAAIVDAYGAAYGVSFVAPAEDAASNGSGPEAEPDPKDDGLAGLDEPPWQAEKAEAMGTVSAGRDAAGRLRIGGEMLVSRDALARLEERLQNVVPDGAAAAEWVERAVREELSREDIALVGVQSLGSFIEVIMAALDTRQSAPPA